MARVLSDYLPRNKLLAYRAVVLETEARSRLAAKHYQTLTKRRRACMELAQNPGSAELAVSAVVDRPGTALEVGWGGGNVWCFSLGWGRNVCRTPA